MVIITRTLQRGPGITRIMCCLFFVGTSLTYLWDSSDFFSPVFSSKNRSSIYNQGWCSKCSLIESNSSTLVSPITAISLEAKMQKFHSLSPTSAMFENADRISSLILVTYFLAQRTQNFGLGWTIWATLSHFFYFLM